MITPHAPPDSVDDNEIVTGDAEIAFVPASERQGRPLPAPDIVITTGQRSRQKKKRKRHLLEGVGDDAEAFNCDSEPSLLDASDEKEAGLVTKRRNRGKHFCPCD